LTSREKTSQGLLWFLNKLKPPRVYCDSTINLLREARPRQLPSSSVQEPKARFFSSVRDKGRKRQSGQPAPELPLGILHVHSSFIEWAHLLTVSYMSLSLGSLPWSPGQVSCLFCACAASWLTFGGPLLSLCFDYLLSH
jgi:hypothetical protein